MGQTFLLLIILLVIAWFFSKWGHQSGRRASRLSPRLFWSFWVTILPVLVLTFLWSEGNLLQFADQKKVVVLGVFCYYVSLPLGYLNAREEGNESPKAL